MINRWVEDQAGRKKIPTMARYGIKTIRSTAVRNGNAGLMKSLGKEGEAGNQSARMALHAEVRHDCIKFQEHMEKSQIGVAPFFPR